MWFNSFAFWLFFALVALGVRLLPHRWANVWLLAASYFFYGCWDWRFLGLIAACTWVNFYAGRRIASANSRVAELRWVWVAFIFSLGVLGFFKYCNFFIEELGELLAWLGLGGGHWTLGILLPVGISFFTFQALSYTMDVYWGDTQPTDSMVDFALFISFFPQLVAGPIERSSHLLPQVINPRPALNHDRFQRGLYWVMTGLFLKVVLADNMAWLANYVFGVSPSDLNGAEVLAGVYAFAFQIYGDFAGYSAIAIGTACWLGFDLMRNFRRPYFARDPREFWQRWHISLSTWLRDYLYIPLGGNRGGEWGTRRNLMLTMLLGGLWHGAAWTFVAWGAVHGLWLVLHRWLAGRQGGAAPKCRWNLLKGMATFHLICFTWLMFRAEHFDQAIGMLMALAGKWKLTAYAQTTLSLLVFFAGPWMLYECWVERKGRDDAMLRVGWPWRACFYGILMGYLLFFPPPSPSEFIYFQF